MTTSVALMLGLVLTGCASDDDGDHGGGGSSATANESPDSSSDPAGSNGSGGEHRDVLEDPPQEEWATAVQAARSEFEGRTTKIELEAQEDGGLEYKVELFSATEKYAAQYDADSLEKLSEKRESLGDEAKEKQRETFDPDKVMSLSDAVAAARDAAPGTYREWKLEGKDTGRVQYEFDVWDDASQEDHEVQVDAHEGTVTVDD